jgi:hypothetical protein
MPKKRESTWHILHIPLLFEFSIWLSRLRIERDFRDLTKKMKDRSKIPINRNSAKTSNEGCDPLSKGAFDERCYPTSFFSKCSVSDGSLYLQPIANGRDARRLWKAVYQPGAGVIVTRATTPNPVAGAISRNAQYIC